MRGVLLPFVALVAGNLCCPTYSHAQSAVLSWPEINLTTCPKVTPTLDPSQRTWKRGQPERDDFEVVTKAKDRQEAAGLLARFAEKYPDSDFRDLALVLEMGIYAALKDAQAQLRVARTMVESPTAEASFRVAGFVTLASLLSPHVYPDDPQKERKLADLDMWVRCGSAAMAAEVRTPNISQENFEKSRRTSESVLDRTGGFVALMRQDYALAGSKLEAARKLNPQDALTHLWLAETKFLSLSPDSNSGIFYLARATELAPQVPQMAVLLKQLYVLAHGSEKGLAEVRALAKTNTELPLGFDIQPPPPKKKHHYGTAIAATSIMGLLVYGAVKCPSCFAGTGGGTGAVAEAKKIMVFGGPGHRTYLGCLSCSQYVPDSVFNEYGRNGSSYSAESIWNSYGQFGSPYSTYSACNPYASDPPVIVDQNGNAYGRLTVNRNSPQLGAGAQFYNWLASAVCHR